MKLNLYQGEKMWRFGHGGYINSKTLISIRGRGYFPKNQCPKNFFPYFFGIFQNGFSLHYLRKINFPSLIKIWFSVFWGEEIKKISGRFIPFRDSVEYDVWFCITLQFSCRELLVGRSWKRPCSSISMRPISWFCSSPHRGVLSSVFWLGHWKYAPIVHNFHQKNSNRRSLDI